MFIDPPVMRKTVFLLAGTDPGELFLPIPEEFVQALGWKEDDPIEVSVANGQILLQKLECDCKFCQYKPEALEVIAAIEKELDVIGVFATEGSGLFDFGPTEDQMKALSVALNIPVLAEDYIWEIAARLRGSRA